MSDLRAAIADRDVERDGWPAVSVVLPVRNEAPHLGRAVASILEQEYPLPLEVCVAVAPSDDGTEAIAAALADRDERVRVVTNAAAVTPAGLKRPRSPPPRARSSFESTAMRRSRLATSGARSRR